MAPLNDGLFKTGSQKLAFFLLEDTCAVSYDLQMRLIGVSLVPRRKVVSSFWLSPQ